MANKLLPDEMLAGLQDIRLPDAAPGGLVAEIAAVVGLGLILAVLLSFPLSLVTRRRREAGQTLEDRLAKTRGLPEAEQAVALLHLIRETDPGFAEELRGRLYRRETFPDTAELEQHLTAQGARHA